MPPELAHMHGAQHIVRRITKTEFEQDLPQIFQAMDQPTIDGVNTWFVAKAAKEAGAKGRLIGARRLMNCSPDIRASSTCRSGGADSAHSRRFPDSAFCPVSFCSPAHPHLPARSRRRSGSSSTRVAGPVLICYAARCFFRANLRSILDPEVVREGLRRLRAPPPAAG